MLSLANAFDNKDIIDFEKKINNYLNNKNVKYRFLIAITCKVFFSKIREI